MHKQVSNTKAHWKITTLLCDADISITLKLMLR